MFNEYIKTFLLTLVSRIGNIFQTNDDDNGIIKLMEIHVCHDMHKTNLDKTMPQATTLVWVILHYSITYHLGRYLKYTQWYIYWI